MTHLGLYIHIPFCRVKCPYCDFAAYARLEELIPDYVDALLREMEIWSAPTEGAEVATVYFGGGTPSLLPLAELERILAGAARCFSLKPGAEVSLEANPGTVEVAYLRGLRALGINRLSLGVQSFHEDELRFLGRDHTVDKALAAYRDAREASFANVNLDLIYGLTGGSLQRWRANLERALALAPEHISLYALAVEERTPLHRWVQRGLVAPPDPDMAAAMYELSEGTLASAGYEHYEISNWARPGFRCRHNLVYWRNEPYLGLGAGAHSFFPVRAWPSAGPMGGAEGQPSLQAFRFANVASPRQYIHRLQAADMALSPIGEGLPNGPLASIVAIDRTREMAETAILALRLVQDGLDEEAFRNRFGTAPQEVWGPQIRELEALGLLEVWEGPLARVGWVRRDGHLRLTSRGRLLSNEVFLRLLPDRAGP